MNSAAVPISIGTPDLARTVEPLGSAVDASLVTLPATRMPVEARGLALGILAALTCVFALSWAQSFVVPLLLGIVVSYTLNPLVAWLEAIKIPRIVGVAAELAAPQFSTGQDQVIVATRQSVGDTVNQVGQELTRRSLNVQPTLTIRPGFRLRVIVN